MGSLSKEELHKKLPNYHVALAPLKTRIYGSVPSKLFELAHFGLPSIYLGSGEGAEVSLEFNLGWFVAPSRWDLFNQLLKRMDDERDWWPKPAEIQATAKANFNPEKQLDKLIEYLNQ